MANQTVTQASNYFDLQGLDQLRQKAQANSKESIREVANQFESMFASMLIKSMRKANEAFESDSPMNSSATKFYEGMFDQQLTSELSQTGSLGLADLIVQQLSPDYQTYKPASVLRSDALFNKNVESELTDTQASQPGFVLQNAATHSLPEKNSTQQWITERFKQQQAQFMASQSAEPAKPVQVSATE